MPATIDEHTVYQDIDGKPLVGGKIFIGERGSDPKLSLIELFSNRELTGFLENPQTLDSLGRTTQKIWLSGRYSLKVEDSNGVQIYLELDAGGDTSGGFTTLVNVSGTGNAITAEGSTTVTGYVDNELYIFRTTQVNTDAVTLAIDSQPVTDIKKNHTQPILRGEFEVGQAVVVVFNSQANVFEWVNQNNKLIDFYQGTGVESDVVTNIWSTGDGNTIHVIEQETPVLTCNSFGVAPNIGARKRLIYDTPVTLTHSSTAINLPGKNNYTTSIGDVLDVHAEALTQADVIIHRINFYQNDSIESALTTDIWSIDANTTHVTENMEPTQVLTCDSFGTAPNIGARRRLIYDTPVTLTHSPTAINLQGQADFTTSIGDVLDVHAETVDQHDVIIHRIDGSPTGKVVTLGVEQPATSSPVVFNIPSGAKNIKLMFVAVSASNSSGFNIRLSSEITGTFPDTGYKSASSSIKGGTSFGTDSSLIFLRDATSNVSNGIFDLSLENVDGSGNQTWVSSYSMGNFEGVGGQNSGGQIGGGSVILVPTGDLKRVEISGNFNGGKFNIQTTI